MRTRPLRTGLAVSVCLSAGAFGVVPAAFAASGEPDDVVERVDAQTEAEHQRAINNDYTRWEAEKSAQANAALELRLERAAAANATLTSAASAHAKAEDLAATASAADRPQAEAGLRQAAAAHSAAVDQAERESMLANHALDQAATEAQNTQRTEASAINAQFAQRSAAQTRGLGVVSFELPKLVVTTANLYARTGPGPGYPVVHQVLAGQRVAATGQTASYYQLADGSYLPSGPTVLASEEAPAPAPIVTPTPHPVPTGVATPSPEPAPTVADPGPGEPAVHYDWETYVANVDAQDAIDECTGGLTYSPEISEILGKAYYPIHNHCNGDPILHLENGDIVEIDDVGTFKVVGSRDVNQGDTTTDIQDLPGTAILQTCYWIGDKMRVVAIEPV